MPDLSTWLTCHLSGLGVGFLPQRLCRAWVESGALVVRKVVNPRQPLPASMNFIHNSINRTLPTALEMAILY